MVNSPAPGERSTLARILWSKAMATIKATMREKKTTLKPWQTTTRTRIQLTAKATKYMITL